MFSMESLRWTSLLLVIFATSISVEAHILPFEEAFLTYGKKLSNPSHANVESCITIYGAEGSSNDSFWSAIVANKPHTTRFYVSMQGSAELRMMGIMVTKCTRYTRHWHFHSG